MLIVNIRSSINSEILKRSNFRFAKFQKPIDRNSSVVVYDSTIK